MKGKWKDFDFTLFLTPLILAVFGIVMIYSASMIVSVIKYDYPSNYFLLKQLQWFALGLVAYLFFSFFNYKHLIKLTKVMMAGIILLLLITPFVAEEINGARSWLVIGPLRLQPAEFAKLGLLIYLSAIYSKKQNYISNFSKAVVPPLIMTSFVLGLILLQPDIGTAAVIFMIACSVIFSSGIKFRHLSFLAVLGIGIILLASTQMVNDERIARFTGAYQPFESPNDDGYHLIQSYLAIGTGGITGQGLGEGVQKLGYLLEPHTDFIMAVIAEELGFIGVGAVIGMLAIIVLRGIYISRLCQDSFGALLAIGISSMIGIQTFINLGAISGLLPITGVTLPFVSYGGSSLLILMTAAGILNNIAYNVRAREHHVSPDSLSAETSASIEKQSYNPALKGGKRWMN